MARYKRDNRALQRIKEAELVLQPSPLDAEAALKLNEARTELQVLTLEALDEQHHAVAAKWQRKGDRYNKEFFQIYKDVQKNPSILQLMVEGEILTQQQEKAAAVTTFYKNLYTEGDET